MSEEDEFAIKCRAKINGTYKGRPFEYIDPKGKGCAYYSQSGSPNRFWWEEGNGSCDCNRCWMLPEGLYEADLDVCSEDIMIDTIEPIDYDGETLVLNETADLDVCSEDIMIDTIEPIDYDRETLVLNETADLD